MILITPGPEPGHQTKVLYTGERTSNSNPPKNDHLQHKEVLKSPPTETTTTTLGKKKISQISGARTHARFSSCSEAITFTQELCLSAIADLNTQGLKNEALCTSYLPSICEALRNCQVSVTFI